MHIDTIIKAKKEAEKLVSQFDYLSTDKLKVIQAAKVSASSTLLKLQNSYGKDITIKEYQILEVSERVIIELGLLKAKEKGRRITLDLK